MIVVEGGRLKKKRGARSTTARETGPKWAGWAEWVSEAARQRASGAAALLPLLFFASLPLCVAACARAVSDTCLPATLRLLQVVQ